MPLCSLALVVSLVGGPAETPSEGRPLVQVPTSKLEAAPVEEPEPTITITPAPAPAIELEPAPEPEPAPELPTGSHDQLPVWDAPSEASTPVDRPRKRKLPNDGGPAIVLGSVALAAGLAILAGSIAVGDDLDPMDRGMMGAIGGLTSVGGGGLIALGATTRTKYRKTALGRAADALPTGRGMQAGGLVLVAGGGGTALAGAMFFVISNYACSDHCTSPFVWGLLGAGLTTLATGTALMVAGEARGKRYRHWADEREVVVQPNLSIGPQGAQIGIRGRF